MGEDFSGHTEESGTTGSLGVWGRGASNSLVPSGGPSPYVAVGDAWLLPESRPGCARLRSHYYYYPMRQDIKNNRQFSKLQKELVYRVSKASVGFRYETKRNLLRPGSSVCTLDTTSVFLSLSTETTSALALLPRGFSSGPQNAQDPSPRDASMLSVVMVDYLRFFSTCPTATQWS